MLSTDIVTSIPDCKSIYRAIQSCIELQKAEIARAYVELYRAAKSWAVAYLGWQCQSQMCKSCLQAEAKVSLIRPYQA